METSAAPEGALKPLTFPADLYRRLVPGQFLSRHLSEAPFLRPSGRRIDEPRRIQCTRGALRNVAQGSSVARLGGTVVTCGVRAEICEAAASSAHADSSSGARKRQLVDRGDHGDDGDIQKADLQDDKLGVVVPNIDLGPLASAQFKVGPPDAGAQSLAARLDAILAEHGVVDLRALGAQIRDNAHTRHTWCLWVDCVVLSYDGGLLTCALAAIVAALKDTVMPAVRYDEGTERVVCIPDEEGERLALGQLPTAVDFAVFEDKVLVDPDEDEERLCQEKCTVVVGNDGSILSLAKSGGTVLQPETLQQILSMAREAAADLRP